MMPGGVVLAADGAGEGVVLGGVEEDAAWAGLAVAVSSFLEEVFSRSSFVL